MEQNFKIKVFTKVNCVKCRMTKLVMDKLHLNYSEESLFNEKGDLSEDITTAINSFSRTLGDLKSAPVIIVTDEKENIIDIWSDFQDGKIKKLAEIVAN